MKLKMAPNSLFAVLLRSPWWISLALVAAIALAARAWLPEQYVPFGMMGGFPFLVIGSIAAVRQWRAPSATQVDAILNRARAMSWHDFSAALENAYQDQGYQVTRLPQGAADLLLTRQGRSTLVACKRWKATNHGAEPLRNLAAALRQHDASAAVYICLTELDASARKAAAGQGVTPVSGVPLAQLLRPAKAFR